ncbi:hypothetical protein [Endozoicomonas arenosclerae]|uniref:hypothetical protein n=1 Tax=Endozoicomonas arenosclerae TaxID=1633495 RepID=UPI0007845BF9|nr:hypothetical protein [Endozoicomonas arenosclerae]
MQKALGLCLGTAASIALAESTLTQSINPSDANINSFSRLSNAQVEQHLLLDRNQFEKAQESFNDTGVWPDSRQGWFAIDQMTIEMQGEGSQFTLCTRVPIAHLVPSKSAVTEDGREIQYTFKGTAKRKTWKFLIDPEQTLAHCSHFEIDGQTTSYSELLKQPPANPIPNTFYTLNIRYGQPLTDLASTLGNAVIPGMLQCTTGSSRDAQRSNKQSSGRGFWKTLCCWCCTSSGETTTPDKAGQALAGGQEPPPPPEQRNTRQEPASPPVFEEESDKGKLKSVMESFQGDTSRIGRIATTVNFSGGPTQWANEHLNFPPTMSQIDATSNTLTHLVNNPSDLISFLNYITDTEAKRIRMAMTSSRQPTQRR